MSSKNYTTHRVEIMTDGRLTLADLTPLMATAAKHGVPLDATVSILHYCVAFDWSRKNEPEVDKPVDLPKIIHDDHKYWKKKKADTYNWDYFK